MFKIAARVVLLVAALTQFAPQFATAQIPGIMQPVLPAGAQCSRPLDTVTGTLPKFAGGLRLLRTAYTGQLINIREASGNTTRDIGPSGCGLDQGAIKAFCGGANCFITKVYDQSGNGNDISQGTNANQPQIYNGSVVQVVAGLGGQVGIKFDGSAMFFQGGVQSTYFSTTQNGTMAAVSAVSGGASGGNRNDVLPFGTSGGASFDVSLGYIAAPTNTFFGAQQTDQTSPISISFTDNAIIAQRFTQNTLNGAYHNGGTPATGVNVDAISLTNTQFIGKNSRPAFWNGFMGEWYFWATMPSQADTNIIGNNIAVYYGLIWTNI